jgi:hypothetical protein
MQRLVGQRHLSSASTVPWIQLRARTSAGDRALFPLVTRVAAWLELPMMAPVRLSETAHHQLKALPSVRALAELDRIASCASTHGGLVRVP